MIKSIASAVLILACFQHILTVKHLKIKIKKKTWKFQTKQKYGRITKIDRNIHEPVVYINSENTFSTIWE
jgi:hypothetical protein